MGRGVRPFLGFWVVFGPPYILTFYFSIEKLKTLEIVRIKKKNIIGVKSQYVRRPNLETTLSVS